MSPSPFDSAPSAFATSMEPSTITARINKFDGNNFHVWKFKMQMVLEERELWEVTSDEIKIEHCVNDGDQVTYRRKSRKAFAMICLAMEAAPVGLIGFGCA